MIEHIRVVGLGELLTRRYPRTPFRSPAFIAGTVQLNGAPVRRRVRCVERQTGLLIAETWSEADGSYRFDDLYPGRPYIVIAMDYALQYNAVIADNVIPVLGGSPELPEVEEKLLSPANLSSTYNSAIQSTVLYWKNSNHTQEAIRVYRDDTPLDTENLPAPIELNAFASTYIDDAVVSGKTYYYMVSAVRGVEAAKALTQQVADLQEYYIYGDGTDVYLYRHDTGTTQLAPLELTRLSVLDFDIENDRIFIGGDDSGGNPRLQVYRLNGEKVYEQSGENWSFDLLVDRAGQQIYLVNIINNQNNVTLWDYNGNQAMTLFTFSTNVMFFAVDFARKIFFGWDSDGRLWRAKLPPVNSVPITSGDIVLSTTSHRAFGVAPSKTQIWFCPEGADTLHYMSYDGLYLTDTGIPCDQDCNVYVDSMEAVYYSHNGDTYRLFSEGPPEIFLPDFTGVGKLLSVQRN